MSKITGPQQGGHGRLQQSTRPNPDDASGLRETRETGRALETINTDVADDQEGGVPLRSASFFLSGSKPAQHSEKEHAHTSCNCGTTPGAGRLAEVVSVN